MVNQDIDAQVNVVSQSEQPGQNDGSPSQSDKISLQYFFIFFCPRLLLLLLLVMVNYYVCANCASGTHVKQMDYLQINRVSSSGLILVRNLFTWS